MMPAIAQPKRGAGRMGAAVERPRVWRPVLEWFARYAEWYLGRHFQGVWLTGAAPDLRGGKPVVIYLNHASWWDPLVCLCAARAVAWHRKNYAPMDATELERFAFFKRLGFYGVEKGTARGAARFLRMSEELLRDPATVLWITPQGRFVDQRQRPVLLKGGIAHLRERCPGAVFVPLAIDYFFGGERLPGVALRFGDAVEGESLHEMEEALERTMDLLAAEVLAGKKGRELLRGKRGMGGVYGFWQRVRGKGDEGEKLHRGGKRSTEGAERGRC